MMQRINSAFTSKSSDESYVTAEKSKKRKKKTKKRENPKKKSIQPTITAQFNPYDLLFNHSEEEEDNSDGEDYYMREARAVETVNQVREENTANENGQQLRIAASTSRSATICEKSVNNTNNNNNTNKNNNNNNTNTNNNNTNTNINNSHNNTKVPTITVYNGDYKKVKAIIKKLNITEYTLKNEKNNKMRVNLKNKGHHQIVQQEFKNQNVEYYTYTYKDEKNITYIIKGIHHSHSPEEVQEEIIQLYPNMEDAIIKIQNFDTNRSNSLKNR